VIVVVGFMGAGKSTVGPLLAERLGVTFVDTDEAIERKALASVDTIFDTAGEQAFRALEQDVVAQVLADAPGVVALGGGAVEDAGTRGALGSADVVHLEVELDEALRRVGGDRPMLRSTDPQLLYARRAELYRAVATHAVATGGLSPSEVAGAIIERLSGPGAAQPRAIEVDLGPRSYRVHVGEGISGSAHQLLPELPAAETAFLVTHPEIAPLAAPLVSSLESLDLRVVTCEVSSGERSKSLAVAGRLYDDMAAAGIRRHDLVVGFGGGVVTDLAGFVASTYCRGIAVVHFPTTLLAQVDAAVGGKTALNLDAGKNLVGSIHQPVAVVCDIALLGNLDEAEMRSGLAEAIKYGFIRSPEVLDFVEREAAAIMGRDPGVLAEIVARCIAIKAEIVAADERETGTRAILNYGHTFAHALEQSAGYEGIRHGEAVAIGMMAAAHLARELDRVDDSVVERHRRLLSSVGLPTSAALDLELLERAWQHDKKHRKGVRFVLLNRIGEAEPGMEAPRSALVGAIERMRS
jgi:3-dehydroquinate synthase/shikimate kinase/3-dehydroquinate synthase